MFIRPPEPRPAAIDRQAAVYTTLKTIQMIRDTQGGPAAWTFLDAYVRRVEAKTPALREYVREALTDEAIAHLVQVGA